MREIVVEAQNIWKSYTAGAVTVDAVKNLSFALYKGELIVVLGPSGSGKSTFLNILGTLDRPTSGSVYFNKLNISQESDEQLSALRRRHIGFVFQFYNLIPTLTALENVEMIAAHSASPMPVEDALKRVNLWERRHHFPSELSGGEQQRVAIARAIVKKPELLLCDEPTGALDVATGVIVLQALEEVHHDFSISVMLITHNATIAHLADRVIRMSGGQILSIERNERHMLARDLSW
ncbi:MAG: hypothetical protein RL189_1466 [Pseudomonadota bacterium]|jgi:putative ABC transport system ATP-binding protein